ncbi:cytochrome C assembly family protein [Arenimonas oryziterrae]|uniref:Cytochrome c assembly protein domain-containing protein n=1 Tax=Arenimonas oryziterrae DSM 21050 = YC6267 TaxID=1121015 RepID=A0A091AM66_9GAMM|nr:cytochrome c biogenesis protein CcsA [Arenimonas oryziterrae]KFN41293.1 hypothetical protein N789_05295 [Arenimonas oryziterrae DSM 21050 = YC6267]
MLDSLIPVAAALAYLLAAGALMRSLRKDEGHARGLLWLVLPAIALHTAAHGLGWNRLNGPDLHFFAALSLVGLGMAALSTIAATSQRLEALRVLVYPLAAFFLLLYHFAGHGKASTLDWQLQLHAWLALLAYASLAIAALLAVMLWFQDKALRQRQVRGWLTALPPLTQLETLLFRSLSASFVVLTLALITGVVFVENLLDQHLVHKTVLSVLSWIVLAVLLFGRWRFGWRGPRAVKLTLTAMALLLLAFFGSAFVRELILHRV